MIWHCDYCGDQATTDDSCVAYFHRCTAPTRFSIRRPPTKPDERQLWARRLLGEALADAVEKMRPDVLLRPLTDDEEEAE